MPFKSLSRDVRRVKSNFNSSSCFSFFIYNRDGLGHPSQLKSNNNFASAAALVIKQTKESKSGIIEYRISDLLTKKELVNGVKDGQARREAKRRQNKIKLFTVIKIFEKKLFTIKQNSTRKGAKDINDIENNRRKFCV